MPFRMIVAGTTLVMMLAACGGAAPAGSTPLVATPASGASATPAAPVTTPAPVTTAPVTVGPGAGDLVACTLITVAEAAAATGVAVALTHGAGERCSYYREGEVFADLVLETAVDQIGVAALNTYIDNPANELVPGIGDKAVIYQLGGDFAGRAIFVRKGTRGFRLDVTDTDIDLAHARTILIQLATMVAGRI